MLVLSATALSLSLYADSAAFSYLRAHVESLQQVLVDPALLGDAHRTQRRNLARVILQQLFDFDEMARRSLGNNAPKYEARMNEFTPLFVDFLEHVYMGTLEENGDAKIRYVREETRGDIIEVDTKTRLRNGSEYSVDYRLLKGPSGWRVYDVTVEGFSLVDNYRAQFDRVLRRKTFDELLQDLCDKKRKFG